MNGSSNLFVWKCITLREFECASTSTDGKR